MNQHKLFLIATILFAALLSGCWDYQGMDEINIVAGAAVDKDEGGGYKLTLEIVNVSGLKEGGGDESLLISAEGPTLFEAVRNAKKRLYNKLYFGSMRTIIVSQSLAEDEGVLCVIDGFMRDIEPRETTYLVISQEDTAQEIISAKGLDTSNVSYEIAEIIQEDNKVDSTSKSVQLYQAYNMIHAKGLELVLPAFRLVKNNGEDAAEINGIAVFQHDRLAGFLSPEEAHYFLMAADDKAGGALSFPYEQDGSDLVSIEIIRCKSKSKPEYTDRKATIHVAVHMQISIVEFPDDKIYSETVMEQVKLRTEEELETRIYKAFRRIQENPGLDIYGFGNQIYEDQYSLWIDIEDQWPTLFQDAGFEIQVNADIPNVGIMS